MSNATAPTGLTKDKLDAKGGLVVGITLFSMFFGAGNLILAPLMGLLSGVRTPAALVGFLISAVGLPVLTIAAIALAGSARELANRIDLTFSKVFVALVYLAIGPFLAIPRTATTSFEMIRPLLGDELPVQLALFLFSLLFFVVAYFMAMHPSRLTSLMGKLSGPTLIALVVILLAATFVAPPGSAAGVASAPYDELPLVAGFVTGYQTMDVLAALAFGIVISMNVRAMGVDSAEGVARQVMRSGVVAGACMAVIYCGFGYLGAVMGSVVPDATNGAEVISAAASVEFGVAGSVLVAAIFTLACLNVCIGLICSIAEYFSVNYSRMGYRRWALLVTILSCLLSNVGLTAILGYSVPLLSALYPVAIVLVIMGLVQRGGAQAHVPAWRLSVALCAIGSVAVALRDGFAPGVELPFDLLPLASMGMGWVLLALVGFAMGLALERFRAKK
ncbi:branched-chain amino acid transport system II carrier protein [Olsenella urininfantis]|uniref:branched-chain amino acid transport system II carrier protein n=1 Tax=Olsenella urininfantis TaxID=1871033 RepID=UPI0009864FAC|nr:branched-chain amino acid transport system II carrier protein [Olsenella urininfantis]